MSMPFVPLRFRCRPWRHRYQTFPLTPRRQCVNCGKVRR